MNACINDWDKDYLNKNIAVKGETIFYATIRYQNEYWDKDYLNKNQQLKGKQFFMQL